MKETLFMRQLNAFFTTHLPETIKRSPNTIAAYADSFAILFHFFHEHKNIPHYLINYRHFTPAAFDEFVFWMDRERHYSESSKKQRISAISSFFKYASRREMAALNALNSVINTEMPRIPGHNFPYFTLEEIKLLLALPDANNNKLGKRDMVLLSLLYDSAARAQELCDLRVCDIRFGLPSKVKLLGKNRKSREVPISDGVANLLRYHFKINGFNAAGSFNKPLFSSQTHEEMTPACIRGITDKYVSLAKSKYPEIFREPKYSPHSFRHSKAVHMAEAGTALIYIRNFLGHASIKSTEIYARVGQAVVTKALSERKIPTVAPELKVLKNNKVQIPDFIASAQKIM